jgi:hypothetical protein
MAELDAKVRRGRWVTRSIMPHNHAPHHSMPWMILLAACAAARPAQLEAERQKQAELAPQLKKLRAACRSDDPTRRKYLETSLKDFAANKTRLQESLSKYPDRKQYEELVAAGTSALHAANRWTDNLHEMYSYVQQMCGREEVSAPPINRARARATSGPVCCAGNACWQGAAFPEVGRAVGDVGLTMVGAYLPQANAFFTHQIGLDYATLDYIEDSGITQ